MTTFKIHSRPFATQKGTALNDLSQLGPALATLESVNPPPRESTPLDTLGVGSPVVRGSDGGTALGMSKWIPEISLDLYIRATKDPAFALKYAQRITTLFGTYRQIREVVKEGVETLRALRAYQSITPINGIPTSLRALQAMELAERRKREKVEKEKALSIVGLTPEQAAIAKSITPEMLALVQELLANK